MVLGGDNGYCFKDGSNLAIGQEFDTKEEVKKNVLFKLAITASFEFDVVKSTKSLYSIKCVSDKCSWRVRVSKTKKSTRFSIRKYCNTHTCDLADRRKRHRQASADVVSNMLLENFRGQQVTPTPKTIMTMMQNRGINISYYKARKGKEFALNKLRAQDGEFHQFLVAWGVVDSETVESWTWFMLRLQEVVPDDEELVIISDRHQGIISAVANVYKQAHHGYCVWHLSQNIKTRSKQKGATDLFMHIAYAYKQSEFDSLYRDMRKRYPQVAKYLEEHTSPDKLSRSHCPRTRYNIMTTNGVESINSRLRAESRYRNAAAASTTIETQAVESILRESCRVHDFDRIPCSHAIAASYAAKLVIYDLCSEYYTTRFAYSCTIYPMPQCSEWTMTTDPLDRKLLPPNVKRKSGRRKVNRNPSIGEFGKR
ncbi:uncharacterized protein [Primulina eburnea]|uniref:uncharacterized protein n=1 Tax=Primulina eburnea TaxID=1245227 RepID=UPI003C6C43F3